MTDYVDFMVMGAGVMGLCTALALHQRGYTVTILEASNLAYDQHVSSRVYALNLASQQLLQTLGIWDQVKVHSAPYERMQVWDAQTTAQIAFDARMLAQDRLGVILEESYLKHALLQTVHASNISLLTQWQTQAVDDTADCITVTSAQQTQQAAFLLIADGARSPTRELLQIPMTTWPYHQHAIIATVAVEHPHERTAYQVFCEQGPLAFLPMQDPRHCAIVWSSATAHVDTLLALSDADFVSALAQTFEHKLGAIQLLSARKSYPLHMQHVRQYTGSRWIILGDAAHTIHPLAGLGLNLGLADLTTFLSLLNGRSPVVLSQRALRSYQRHRKHELWQMILFLQAMHQMFTHAYFPMKLLRRFGLTLCDRLPWVKRRLMAHASGVSNV